LPSAGDALSGSSESGGEYSQSLDRREAGGLTVKRAAYSSLYP
jgi:hypothetical protein